MTDQSLAAPPFFLDGGPALHEWLRQARDNQPVALDGTAGVWRVYRYEAADEVLSNWEVYSNDMCRIMPAHEFTRGNLSTMDPPDHKQLRSVISQGFTPRVLAGLASRIEQIVAALLDAVDDRDEIDLVGDLAYQLPLNVIAEVLGVPEPDRPVLQRCADAQLALTCENPADTGFVVAVQKAMEELREYLAELSDERRRRPREDLVSRLVTADVDGRDDGLDGEEVVNFSALLLLAGHLTTMGLLGNMMVTLDEHPDAMAAVRADRSLVPGAIEEVLRYRPPVPDGGRVTNREVTLGGATIPADKLVMVSLVSANRDERQFSDPERFDIRRHPNPHLAFTTGIHYCLGAHLSRLEAKIALNALFDRYTSLERTGLEWYQTLGLCAARRMPFAVRRR